MLRVAGTPEYTFVPQHNMGKVSKVNYRGNIWNGKVQYSLILAVCLAVGNKRLRFHSAISFIEYAYYKLNMNFWSDADAMGYTTSKITNESIFV